MNKLEHNLTQAITELKLEHMQFNDTLRTIEVLDAINKYFTPTEDNLLTDDNKKLLKKLNIYGR